MQRLLEKFSENPIPWVLAGLLAFSVYAHYQTSTAFTQTCGSLLYYLEGYPNLDTASMDPTGAALQQRIETHQRLMQEDSEAGRQFRWTEKLKEELSSKCSDRFVSHESPPRW